jgi:hypothetical protein
MDERSMEGAHRSLTERIAALWDRQSTDWPALRDGIASLRQARTRSFTVHGSTVVAQSNAKRIASSAARVDAASLAARPCFLCPDRLPEGQQSIACGPDWLLLCNPAPVTVPHLTVTATAHLPQRIEPAFPVMLRLAADLAGAYTIFYNGPRAGASAPDHLHAQAVPTGALPFEADLCRRLENGGWLEWLGGEPVRRGITRPGTRPAIVLQSDSERELNGALPAVLAAIDAVRPAAPEPMINLFAACRDGRWTVWLFPRSRHRPAAYGREPGDYCISPGCVDLAGLLIVPRPHDFERLTQGTVTSILDDVLLDAEDLQRLRARLAPAL